MTYMTCIYWHLAMCTCCEPVLAAGMDTMQHLLLGLVAVLWWPS